MLILKDLTSMSAKGYRGLLYLIFNFDIKIAILWYNAAQILKGWYYCKWLFVYCKNRHSGWRAELPLTYHFSFSSIDWQTYSAVCLHSSNKDSLQVFWCMCQKHKVITILYGNLHCWDIGRGLDIKEVSIQPGQQWSHCCFQVYHAGALWHIGGRC